MEKCESCQKGEMSFEKANPEPNPDEEGMWVCNILNIILAI